MLTFVKKSAFVCILLIFSVVVSMFIQVVMVVSRTSLPENTHRISVLLTRPAILIKEKIPKHAALLRIARELMLPSMNTLGVIMELAPKLT